jgi:hypothetical protein
MCTSKWRISPPTRRVQSLAVVGSGTTPILRQTGQRAVFRASHPTCAVYGTEMRTTSPTRRRTTVARSPTRISSTPMETPSATPAIRPRTASARPTRHRSTWVRTGCIASRSVIGVATKPARQVPAAMARSTTSARPPLHLTPATTTLAVSTPATRWLPTRAPMAIPAPTTLGCSNACRGRGIPTQPTAARPFSTDRSASTGGTVAQGGLSIAVRGSVIWMSPDRAGRELASRSSGGQSDSARSRRTGPAPHGIRGSRGARARISE